MRQVNFQLKRTGAGHRLRRYAHPGIPGYQRFGNCPGMVRILACGRLVAFSAGSWRRKKLWSGLFLPLLLRFLLILFLLHALCLGFYHGLQFLDIGLHTRRANLCNF